MNPYAWFLKLRDYFYASKKIQVFKAEIPVISVGNLNTGGSGKTPFIQFLVAEIQKKFPQKKIVIISKSYRGSLSEPREVTSTEIHEAEFFGDEACLLKSSLKVDVWAGPVKYLTLEKALQNKNYDLVLIDDGFSHRKIVRDLEIVLFDVSRQPAHYQLLPYGRMREPWEALSRSDMVILTKLEHQEEERIKEYTEQIRKFQPLILTTYFKWTLPTDKKNVFLYTGVGHPETIKENLIQADFKILKSKIYPDHYAFPLSEQIKIAQEFEEFKLTNSVELVSTTKDLIKIKNPVLLKETKVIQLQIDMPEDQRKVLHEQISRLF